MRVAELPTCVAAAHVLQVQGSYHSNSGVFPVQGQHERFPTLYFVFLTVTTWVISVIFVVFGTQNPFTCSAQLGVCIPSARDQIISASTSFTFSDISQHSVTLTTFHIVPSIGTQ